MESRCGHASTSGRVCTASTHCSALVARRGMHLVPPAARGALLGMPNSKGSSLNIARDIHAAASIQIVPTTQTGAPSIRIKLPRHKRPLCWHRWERALYARILQREAQRAAEDQEAVGDDWYYSVWDHPDAHRQLLDDQVRTSVWRDVLLGSPAGDALLAGKTVMDVGAGLGVLSMMAAQAGARHVYAVEASPGAADLATRVIRANGLSHKVTVLCGRAETVRLPEERVDVLISDWMGPFLLHGSLLPALARARDRWLAPDGVVLPGSASLVLAGVDDRDYLAGAKADWGRRVAGFDLSAALHGLVRHPRLDTPVRASDVVTDAAGLLQLDVAKAGLHSLVFKRPFKLTAKRAGRVSGLIAWFDAHFDTSSLLQDAGLGEDPGATGDGGSGGDAEAGVTTLTTHPLSPATGLLQTVFSFPRALKMEAGEQLSGVLSCRPAPGSPQGRSLDVDVEINFKGMTARVAYQLRRPLLVNGL